MELSSGTHAGVRPETFSTSFSPLLLEGQGRSSRTPTASTHGLQVSSAQQISNLERPHICLLVILLSVFYCFLGFVGGGAGVEEFPVNL